jgi:hypothetical protein
MMLTFRVALSAALLLAPAVSLAKDAPLPPKPKSLKPAAKSTPVPAKPVPAKTAAKPPTKAAAPAATAKAASKPTTPKPAKPKAAKPLSDRASRGKFGVLQVAAGDAGRFTKDWRLGIASADMTTSTVANSPLFTFLIFRGCKPGADGKCDLVADFVIYRPDGTTNEDNKGIVVWARAAPESSTKSTLGDGALGFGTDAEGPFGEYRVVATVTDRVAKISVTTQQVLTITEK